MVCPLSLALGLADQKLRGFMDFPEPTSALIIVTGIEDSPLEAHHRDLLWSAFGLPVFEQLRGPAGAVIARECEVHDGLHVEDRAALPPGTELLTTACDCGNELPRVRVVRAAAPKFSHAVA
ncbi:MAG: hypothetical protein M3N54_07885 [Acidobacteriota bacterium]|nr:hypothetical protein [Acidobacteriota bacterium]